MNLDYSYYILFISIVVSNILRKKIKFKKYIKKICKLYNNSNLINNSIRNYLFLIRLYKIMDYFIFIEISLS